MNWIQRRRAAMGIKSGPEDLVVSFTPVTQTFTWQDKIVVPLKEVIVGGGGVVGSPYTVVLDGTVPAGFHFLVLLGAINNKIEYYPDGQDGEITRTWTTNKSGSASTANAYIYCRPVSGQESCIATIRNIKIFKEGW